MIKMPSQRPAAVAKELCVETWRLKSAAGAMPDKAGLQAQMADALGSFGDIGSGPRRNFEKECPGA